MMYAASAQLWQYRDRRKPETGTMPYSCRMPSRFFILHNKINSTAHSRHLNSWEHWICTVSMTSIRPDRNSSPVHLSFEPQPDRMSHRGRPGSKQHYDYVSHLLGIRTGNVICLSSAKTSLVISRHWPNVVSVLAHRHRQRHNSNVGAMSGVWNCCPSPPIRRLLSVLSVNQKNAFCSILVTDRWELNDH